jgi:hypothetical protein
MIVVVRNCRKRPPTFDYQVWTLIHWGDTMKYLCLVYHEEAKIDALAETVQSELICETIEFRDHLRRSGYEIASSPLQPAKAATTIRVRDGTLAITEGPVATTQEQLGGFYLIEARDLNDAIRVASRMPPARIGCIEVRPLQEFPTAICEA